MFMSVRAIFFGIALITAFLAGPASHPVAAAGGVTLYTPYTRISVPPGESIDYSVEILNNGSEVKDIPLYVSGIPKAWVHSLKSGGWNIEQISVLPGEKKNVTLHVDVPLKVNKGNYHFNLVARGYESLPLTVNVSAKGTYKTEFTSNQVNMEGHAGSNFTFSTELMNQTEEKQLYSLRSNAPRGWEVTFKPAYKQATAVEISPNEKKSITIEIKPPAFITAGAYKIPVMAVTNSTSAKLELEVVITGTYDMELTTPTGLLSTKIKAGGEKKLPLLIKNTGSSALTNIKFRTKKPSDWEVTFDPKSVDRVDAGKDARVIATLKASNKAIAGDYATTITAYTPESTSNASFRISVRTPMIWGWVGILIILAAIGSVLYLFRKYGRR